VRVTCPALGDFGFGLLPRLVGRLQGWERAGRAAVPTEVLVFIVEVA
jgi:hypothetical protein